MEEQLLYGQEEIKCEVTERERERRFSAQEPGIKARLYIWAYLSAGTKRQSGDRENKTHTGIHL